MAEALFDNHRTLRAVIESVLEGRLGRSTIRDGAARLDLGCYAIFGGDAASDAVPALVNDVVPPRELLVPDEQAWRDRLHEAYGERLEDRTMRTFATDGLDVERLRTLAGRVPAGFTVEPFTAATATQLDLSILPHALRVFDDAEHFADEGIGYGAFDDGTLACAATSYAVSSQRVEIAIATKEEYRGKRLARVTAAAMLAECLGRGLTPDWSAANPISKHLAISLGYRPAALCDIIYLERP